MTPAIQSGDDLHRLLQNTYFDSIDSGDAKTAVTALHENVEWVHRQVWEHDGHTSDDVDVYQGRDAVFEFLDARIGEMQREGIEHRVEEAICEGDRGAFRAVVVGPEGAEQPFFGWVELADGLVSMYSVTPK
jgi:ketosteroid isomerase-like protein